MESALTVSLRIEGQICRLKSADAEKSHTSNEDRGDVHKHKSQSSRDTNSNVNVSNAQLENMFDTVVNRALEKNDVSLGKRLSGILNQHVQKVDKTIDGKIAESEKRTMAKFGDLQKSFDELKVTVASASERLAKVPVVNMQTPRHTIDVETSLWQRRACVGAISKEMATEKVLDELNH